MTERTSSAPNSVNKALEVLASIRSKFRQMTHGESLLAELEAMQIANPNCDLTLWTVDKLEEYQAAIGFDSDNDDHAAHLWAYLGILQAASMIYPWRLAKIAVQLDADFEKALEETELLSLPAAALTYLPYRYFWISVSGIVFANSAGNNAIDGVLVRYIPDDPINNNESTIAMMISFTVDGVTHWQSLYLAEDHGLIDFNFAKSICDEVALAVSASFDLENSLLGALMPLNQRLGSARSVIENNRSIISKMLKILAYLASRGADYTRIPCTVQAVKTKRGMRLFDRQKAQPVLVGNLIGAQLRTAASHYGEPGAHKRPHFRRPHFYCPHGHTQLVWRSGSFINAHLNLETGEVHQKNI